MLSFKPVFSFSSFTFIKRLVSSSSLSDIRVTAYHRHQGGQRQYLLQKPRRRLPVEPRAVRSGWGLPGGDFWVR